MYMHHGITSGRTNTWPVCGVWANCLAPSWLNDINRSCCLELEYCLLQQMVLLAGGHAAHGAHAAGYRLCLPVLISVLPVPRVAWPSHFVCLWLLHTMHAGISLDKLPSSCLAEVDHQVLHVVQSLHVVVRCY